MKQFQFEYKNINNYYRELSRIERFLARSNYSSIFFQFFTQEKEISQIRFMTDIIQNKFPNAYYYGCQSNGNIINGDLGKYKTLIICSVFEYDNTTAQLVYIDPTSNNPNHFKSLNDLWEYCNKIDDLKLIELTSAYQAADILNIGIGKISLKEGVDVIGAIASHPTDMTSSDSLVFTKEYGFSYTGVIAVLLGGADLHVKTNYHTGWLGIGRTFTITSCEGKIIKAIDNEPAMNIYRKYLGIDYGENFLNAATQFPLLLTQHNVECIRIPMPMDNYKSNDIRLTVDVKEGTKVRLSYGEPNTIIKTVKESTKEIFDFEPDTIRIYSCSIRRLFWGDEKVGLETEALDDIASTVGFYTHGELIRIGSYLHYLNSTIVTCLVREGDVLATQYTYEENNTLDNPNSDFSSKLIHFVDAITKEVEGKYFKNIERIANTYHLMCDINLKEELITVYNQVANVDSILKANIPLQEKINLIADLLITNDYKEKASDFLEISTLSTRIKNVPFIYDEFVGVNVGWFRAQFIPMNWDENNNLVEVMFVTQIIDDEKKKEELLLHQTITDDQTGLYNRRAYENDILSYKDSGLEDRFVYISFDLNGLKITNDTLGHQAGDELIYAAGKILKQVFSPYGKVYRTGGDEFVALIFITDTQLPRIIEDFNYLQANWHGKLVNNISISMGVITKKSRPDLSIEEIEKEADDLMYKDKASYYHSLVK